ncbi:hypothetical protein [Rhodanobacter sp. A1T4]|uniref:AbiU2 domain-containing protein n=1 Tax=Rhodanobacter sp. A1T4 TaxID=2723087 RepID=UPI00160DB085|nr:hypothetical protein [Rhodanobacter sp. A1T4]MBB6247219.1 hypothetical protein [Rhodanobacter sp. A1T4]
MIAVKTSEEFSRLLESLANDVVHANIHWKQWNDLASALDAQPQVWAQSRTFWHLTLNANIFTALQSLCRAYDQHQKSLHLLSWLKTIQANTHLFGQDEFKRRLAGNPFVDSLATAPRAPDPNVLEQDIELCSISDPDVRLLMQYRGNFLAHRNAKSTSSGTANNGKYALPGTQIEVLLERAKTILNRYSYLFSASTHSVNMLGHDDYKYVFKSVQAAIDRFPHDG